MKNIPVKGLTSEDDTVTKEKGPECYAQLKVLVQIYLRSKSHCLKELLCHHCQGKWNPKTQTLTQKPYG